MKEYVIWVQGSECILGIIEESVIDAVLESYVKGHSKYITFSDETGKVSIRRKYVLAIAVNEISHRHKAGF